jgi:hypothetical protein
MRIAENARLKRASRARTTSKAVKAPAKAAAKAPAKARKS